MQEFGWTRSQVTSGNALSKLVVGPALGFFTGWMVDRFPIRWVYALGFAIWSLSTAAVGVVYGLPSFLLARCPRLDGHMLGDQLVRATERPLEESRALVPPLVQALRRTPGADWRARLSGLGIMSAALARVALGQHLVRRDPLEAARRRVRDQLMVQRIIRRKVGLRVSVTEGEIDRYLAENREKLETGLTFEARHMLFLPTPGAGQVRVRVRYCGLCHTDLHTVEGDLPLPRLPIVPGHQVVGIVEAVGAGARGL